EMGSQRKSCASSPTRRRCMMHALMLALIATLFLPFAANSQDLNQYIKRCETYVPLNYENPLTFAKVESMYDKYDNVMDLLDALNAEHKIYERDHVQIWASRSLDKDIADKKHPRV